MKGYKEFGGTFFPGFFFPFYLLGQGEKYTGKKLTETQSMKIQIKSGEIAVCQNVGKIMRNVDSRRLTPKLSNMQNSVTGKHGKRFENIKNRYGRQVGSQTNKKYVDCLECGTI